MTLQTWIIEPRDSVIFRDGKPFGADITHASSLNFPFPSTTTGGARTRAGLDANGIFDDSQVPVVKDIEVRGSLLAEIDQDTQAIKEFYLPSPADCLVLQNKNQKNDGNADVFRLLPLSVPGVVTNLKDSLLPVGITKNDTRLKPYTDLRFWYWRKLENWLLRGNNYTNQPLSDFGIKNLIKDARTHVAINLNMASKQIEEDEGGMFSTRGLELNYGNGFLSTNPQTAVKKFGLAVFVDDANSRKLENKGGLAPLGGERRLVFWRKDAKSISVCPDSIKNQIINQKHCRLLMLTPAFFSDGMPKSTDDYEIRAIACERYQTVSGWDFAFTGTKNGRTIHGQPKPTRRLLPAGSVLFLDLRKNSDIESWINNTWFHPVGDDAQFVKDGFGLSVLGTWDGNCLDKWE